MTRVWPALLVVHVAWSVHLVVSYYLAWAACTGGDGWLLALRHVTTAVALGVGLAASWRAYHAQRATAPERPERLDPQESAAEHAYLARLTLVLGVLFLFAILLAGATNLFIDPCR
jgi:hypothetical protein